METPPTRSLKIFALEDHPDSREILKKHLESLGHVVATAGSLHETVLGMRSGSFDVFISDIGLGDGLGWDFMASLHFARPVYAIAISGVGDPQDVARSKQVGFRHHLTKPIDFALLEKLLAEAADETSRPDVVPIRGANLQRPPLSSRRQE